MAYRCYTVINLDRYCLDLLVPKLRKEATSRQISFTQVGQEVEVFTTSIKAAFFFVYFALDLCRDYRDDDDEPALKGSVLAARTNVYKGKVSLKDYIYTTT